MTANVMAGDRERSDWTAAARAAHSLKGSAAQIGAKTLTSWRSGSNGRWPCTPLETLTTLRCELAECLAALIAAIGARLPRETEPDAPAVLDPVPLSKISVQPAQPELTGQGSEASCGASPGSDS